MKLEIDTNKKTICILEETSVLEVLNFLKSLESEDYKIVSKQTEIERNPIRYIPITPANPNDTGWKYDPYNPYQVTCNT
jgi:hypothetical protein